MTDFRIGVIGIPGKWSTEVLADNIEQRTGFRLVIDMNEVCLDLTTQSLNFKGHNLCDLDALVVKKISQDYNPNTLNRLELLRIAENQGVRVFSGAANMLRLINRLSCTVTLQNANIPMPETVITESVEAAFDAVQSMGSVVLKPLFSTKARGMCVLRNNISSKSLKNQIQAFHKDNPMMYIQKKLNLPGRDLGLIFLGGQYLGAYARVPQDPSSWNTTIHSGGRYEVAFPDDQMINIATRAQAAFAMDFTTVDVAEADTGPIVFEVSAFGGFKGALEGANIDAANAYTQYVLGKLNDPH